MLVPPKATLGLVETILEHTDFRLVREDMLKVERGRQEERAQERLNDSVDPKLLLHLCCTQRGERLRELFDWLILKAPMRAIRLLESMDENRRAELEVEHLWASDAVEVLVPLLETARGEEARDLYRRVRARWPGRALAVLEAMDDEQLAAFAPDDFLENLASEDARLRQRALILAGRAGQPEQVESVMQAGRVRS